MSLEKSKTFNEVNEPLHPSTNPEILVKIGQLAFEIQVFRCQPLKKLKNKEKTSAKYIALPASLPSGIKIFFAIP